MATDANTLTAGDQAFAFIGAANFSHVAGELRVFAVTGGYDIQGDVNGDGHADFTLFVNSAPAAGDFIL